MLGGIKPWLLALFVVGFAGGCKDDAGAPAAVNPLESCVIGDASKETVIALLERYRNDVAARVPAADRAEIERVALALPVDAAEPVGVTSVKSPSGLGYRTELTPLRRDVAYAAAGVAYTLSGGLDPAQRPRLDVGFWAFLEAALLRPDDVESLIDVAFHLAERRAWDDARVVLLRARALASDSPEAHANLAYVCAGKGDNAGAVSELLTAVALAPERPSIRDRLAAMQAHAGFALASASTKFAVDPANNPPPIPSINRILNLSTAGLAALDDIDRISAESAAALEEIERPLSDAFAPKMAAFQSAVQLASDADQRCVFDPGTVGAIQQCQKCHVPFYDAINDASAVLISEARFVAATYVPQALDRLSRDVARAAAGVAGAAVEPADRAMLMIEVHERVFGNNSVRAFNSKTLADAASVVDPARTIAFGMAASCLLNPSGVPLEAPPLLDVQLYDPGWLPELYFNFGVGSIELTSEKVKVSIGQGISAKVEYDFKKEKWGVGAALGVNLGVGPVKLGKAEAEVLFRASGEVEGGLNVKAALPKLVPVPLVPPKAQLVRAGTLLN